MTHPTDDELEAMARDIERYDSLNLRKHTSAMLRACKGRVKAGQIERIIWSAMVWAAENNPGFNGVPEYTDRGNSFAENECRATASRILAALEPAPDHSEWNADDVYQSVGEALAGIGHDDVSPEARKKIKRALDGALKKKGQTSGDH